MRESLGEQILVRRIDLRSIVASVVEVFDYLSVNLIDRSTFRILVFVNVLDVF